MNTKYLKECLNCKKTLVNCLYSISYCSDECRNEHSRKYSYNLCRVRKGKPSLHVRAQRAAIKSELDLSKIDPYLTKHKLKEFRGRKKGRSWKKQKVKILLYSNQKLQDEIRLLKKGIENKQPNKIIIETKNNPVSFYNSKAWRELRYLTLAKYGRKCRACGTSSGKMHVDHIKPRSKYPHLELDPLNLQILCEDCNLGKSNKDETDWRANENHQA